MKIYEQIPSDFEVLPPTIESVINRIRQKVNLQEQETFYIHLALEEALTNAVKHGNKFNPNLNVDLWVNINGNLLEMTIKDQGQGFDFRHVPDPTDKERRVLTSGRGVFLIKKIMDQVVFEEGGRQIKMLKRLANVS